MLYQNGPRQPQRRQSCFKFDSIVSKARRTFETFLNQDSAILESPCFSSRAEPDKLTGSNQSLPKHLCCPKSAQPNLLLAFGDGWL